MIDRITNTVDKLRRFLDSITSGTFPAHNYFRLELLSGRMSEEGQEKGWPKLYMVFCTAPSQLASLCRQKLRMRGASKT